MPTAVPDHRTINISLISDLTCAWCYVGLRHIDLALARLTSESAIPPHISIEVEHKPFLLHSELDQDVELDKGGYLQKKLGTERWNRIKGEVHKKGEAAGIKFCMSEPLSNTIRAHRLLLLAHAKGGAKLQHTLLLLMYKAHFEHALSLSNPAILASLADRSGLMKASEAIAWIKGDELHELVISGDKCARRCGVTGVPSALFDHKWAISGGQEQDVYYNILQRLIDNETPDPRQSVEIVTSKTGVVTAKISSDSPSQQPTNGCFVSDDLPQ